jgi:hypothetical protein
MGMTKTPVWLNDEYKQKIKDVVIPAMRRRNPQFKTGFISYRKAVEWCLDTYVEKDIFEALIR